MGKMRYNYVYGVKEERALDECRRVRDFLEFAEDTSDTFYGIVFCDRKLFVAEREKYGLFYLGNAKINVDKEKKL